MEEEDRKVIVVLGSVTAKQYDRIRLAFIAAGEKVTIQRVEDDFLGDILACDVDDETMEDDVFVGSRIEDEEDLIDLTDPLVPGTEDYFQAGIIIFCERYDIDPKSVVAVVAREDAWLAVESDMNHAFSSFYSSRWPALREVVTV